MLHRAGIACRVFEATPNSSSRVGINILPHASRELAARAEDALAKVAITTREYCFYNRYGQYIYSEPAGKSPATTCRNSHPSWRSADGAA